MRNILATLFMLMLASTTVWAADQGQSNDALDGDEDGKISLQEAAADESLAAKFNELDTDGDGYLSGDELQ